MKGLVEFLGYEGHYVMIRRFFNTRSSAHSFIFSKEIMTYAAKLSLFFLFRRHRR